VLHEAGRLVFLPLISEDTTIEEIPATLLTVPSSVPFIEAGCRIVINEIAGSAPLEGGDVAIMDAGAVVEPITIRGWLPGDRYRPLGAPGSRKLQDIFVDAGVPRRLRKRIPIVCDKNGIIWVAGFRIADRVKYTPTTVRGYRFSIEWELNPWTI
jgi:tRNA(Ile)-lysidine synthase